MIIFGTLSFPIHCDVKSLLLQVAVWMMLHLHMARHG